MVDINVTIISTHKKFKWKCTCLQHISSNNKKWMNPSQIQGLRKLKQTNWQKLIHLNDMKESQDKMNLKTAKNQDKERKLELIFWMNRWGLCLLLGSLKSLKKTNWQKRIKLNHMKESQGKMNLKMKKNPATDRKMELKFWRNRLRLSLLLRSWHQQKGICSWLQFVRPAMVARPATPQNTRR